MAPRNRRSYFSDALDELDEVAPKSGALVFSDDSPPESDSDPEAQATAPRRRPWCQSIQRHWGKMLIGILTLAAWISYRMQMGSAVGNVSRGSWNWSLLGRAEGAQLEHHDETTPVLQDPFAVCKTYQIAPERLPAGTSAYDKKTKEWYKCTDMVLRQLISAFSEHQSNEVARRVREGDVPGEEIARWLRTFFQKTGPKALEKGSQKAIDQARIKIIRDDYDYGLVGDNMEKQFGTSRPERESEKSWVGRVGNLVGNWSMRNPFGAAGMNASSKPETIPHIFRLWNLNTKSERALFIPDPNIWENAPRTFTAFENKGKLTKDIMLDRIWDLIYSDLIWPAIEDRVTVHISLHAPLLRDPHQRTCYEEDTWRKIAPYLDEIREHPNKPARLLEVLRTMYDDEQNNLSDCETVNWANFDWVAASKGLSFDEADEVKGEIWDVTVTIATELFSKR